MSTQVVPVGQEQIGSKDFFVCAGPCAVESEKLFKDIADFVISQGARGVRGGVYKLRTNPKSFQGLGLEALTFIKNLRAASKFLFMTEITDPRQRSSLEEVVDIFQVGTRNMFNYELLKELGKTKKPVLLKRGFSARIEEWLLAAEYLASSGNNKIILCERGIRTFETHTRNTLDLSAVAVVKKISPYPVLVDPSHALGDHSLVPTLAKASVAAGADGLLLEVHPRRDEALCDGAQALSFSDFSSLMQDLKRILPCFDKVF